MTMDFNFSSQYARISELQKNSSKLFMKQLLKLKELSSKHWLKSLLLLRHLQLLKGKSQNKFLKKKSRRTSLLLMKSSLKMLRLRLQMKKLEKLKKKLKSIPELITFKWTMNVQYLKLIIGEIHYLKRKRKLKKKTQSILIIHQLTRAKLILRFNLKKSTDLNKFHQRLYLSHHYIKNLIWLLFTLRRKLNFENKSLN